MRWESTVFFNRERLDLIVFTIVLELSRIGENLCLFVMRIDRNQADSPNLGNFLLCHVVLRYPIDLTSIVSGYSQTAHVDRTGSRRFDAFGKRF